jgi:hypothetical protein
VAGLERTLANLPKEAPEQLTSLDITLIKKAIDTYQLGRGSFLGTGNGFTITQDVNTYLLEFFNTFLKGEGNSSLKKCTALSKNTHLQCGPGQG